MDTPREGKLVVGFWRGQHWFGVDTFFPGGTMQRGCHDLQVKRIGRDNATDWVLPMLTLSSLISSTRISLQPLAAPTMKLVDMVKNKAQAVERRNLVMEPQWTARSQNISINIILKSEMKGSIKTSSLLGCPKRIFFQFCISFWNRAAKWCINTPQKLSNLKTHKEKSAITNNFKFETFCSVLIHHLAAMIQK